MRRPLPRDFYARATEEVARELLGCKLVREHEGRIYEARIVETEAYVGPHDRACHASRGITPRTEVLYGPPGRAYVYFIYGMHFLLNAVTDEEGHGAGVLFRGLEPLEGFGPEDRTNGPARLTKTLSVDKELNRWDLTLGERLWIESGSRTAPIAVGPRIGVDYAGEWARAPLRFWEEGNPWVSR